jgi:hypothetical protein
MTTHVLPASPPLSCFFPTLLTVLTVLSCTHPDDPVSGSGFALDVKTPAGTPVSDVGGQRVRGGFGPTRTVPRNVLTAATGAGTQKISGAPCPEAALGHDLPEGGVGAQWQACRRREIKIDACSGTHASTAGF